MSEINDQPLSDFEQALTGFTASAPTIDRDRLMFMAGRANAEGSGFRVQGSVTTRHSGNWLWPASAGVLAATSLALAIALAVQADKQPTVVYRDRPAVRAVPDAPQENNSPAVDRSLVAATAPTDRTTRSAANTYLQTREVALRMGLDALGSPQYSAEPPAPNSYRDLWLGLTSSRLPSATKEQIDQSSM
jgi:hypothetical protein